MVSASFPKKRAFEAPWKAKQQASQNPSLVQDQQQDDGDDEFTMSQRWISPFRTKKRPSMASQSRAVTVKSDSLPSNGRARRRLPFGGRLPSAGHSQGLGHSVSARAAQGLVASQVLQSMQERSLASQQHVTAAAAAVAVAEGSLVGGVGGVGAVGGTGVDGEQAVLKRVDALEERLVRIQETIEGLVRGVGKYTARVEGRDEEAVARRISADVVVQVMRGLEGGVGGGSREHGSRERGRGADAESCCSR